MTTLTETFWKNRKPTILTWSILSLIVVVLIVTVIAVTTKSKNRDPSSSPTRGEVASYDVITSGRSSTTTTADECKAYADSHPNRSWDSENTFFDRPPGCVVETTTGRVYFNSNTKTSTRARRRCNPKWECIQTKQTPV